MHRHRVAQRLLARGRQPVRAPRAPAALRERIAEGGIEQAFVLEAIERDVHRPARGPSIGPPLPASVQQQSDAKADEHGSARLVDGAGDPRLTEPG
jgi:hypothetical protein